MALESEIAAKNRLRSSLRRQRDNMLRDEVQRLSGALQAQLIRWLGGHNFDAICAYFPIQNEPDIHSAMGLRTSESSTWYFPRVTGSTAMEFVSWQPGEAQHIGKFRITEPVGGQKLTLENQKVLFLVPCLAVDQSGTRLGSGGGFYDRYLANLPQNCDELIIAVCFEAFIQKLPLPREAFDVPVDGILSESGVKLIQRP